MRSFTIAVLLILPAISSVGQNINNIVVDERANGKNLSDFLASVEEEHQVDFIFADQLIRPLTIGVVPKRVYMSTFLNDFLEPFNLGTVKVKDNIMFIVDASTKEDFGRKKENYIIIDSNGNSKLTGGVTYGSTDEPVFGSQVTIPELKMGTLTDRNGTFELRMPEQGIFKIDIQYLGYDTKSYIVGLSRYGKVKNIETSLLSSSFELEGVTVTANRNDQNIKRKIAGIENLDIKNIKELPAFLGEIDPVRNLTTLPGVSTAGEISSGFNVRGGQAGQNLVRQDGAIIYNPTHLFGFFSAFNPDMIDNVVLYKGGGPAMFGGRIASVLDVKLRNGDGGKFTVKGGVGMISSRLTLEGPIAKSKSSFLIGGRISYSDWLLKATDNIDLKQSSANFNDLTAKLFQTINDKNLISISGYRSHDNFRLRSDSTFAWGTNNIALKWDHTFNDRLISGLSIASSNYYSEVSNDNEIEAFKYKNGISNLSVKYDFLYTKSESVKYNFGIEIDRSKIEPGKLAIEEGGNSTPIDINDQSTLESAAFFQSDLELTDKWALSAGLRYSHFLRLGKDAIYGFDYNRIEGRYPAIVDTTYYSNNQVIKTYSGLEPRVSLRYLIGAHASLKASYYRGYQYLHLVSNTTSVTPQDYWISSGPYLKPQIGDQFSLGYFGSSNSNIYEFSTEFFYKDIANTVDFIEGADVTLNETLEAGFSQGRGTAYGVEVLLKKTEGLLYGWLSYTYSRSLLEFNSNNLIKRINDGVEYPSNYDQPHNLSLVLSIKLGPRTTLSSNFNYKSGRPITIPISKFTYDAYLAALNYSSRNEYRIPDYHRFDLSLNIKERQRRNTSFRGEWILSVFNVYGRKNAYSIFFHKNGRANKLSILGNIFPSITYNFNF